jgi:hypothetical protein
MAYKFKFKRHLFWKTYAVDGHRYDEKQDKVCLFFEDGSLREIKDWKKCIVKLGPDWALTVKKALEKEAGVPIQAKV